MVPLLFSFFISLFAETSKVSADRLNHFFPLAGREDSAVTDMMRDFYITSKGDSLLETDKWNIQNETTPGGLKKTIVSMPQAGEYAIQMGYDVKDSKKTLREVVFISSSNAKDFLAELNDNGTVEAITFRAPFGINVPATINQENCRKFLSEELFKDKTRDEILKNSAQCFSLVKKGLDVFRGVTEKPNAGHLSKIKNLAQKNLIPIHHTLPDPGDSSQSIANAAASTIVFNHFLEKMTRICIDFVGPERLKPAPPRKRNLAPNANSMTGSH